MSLLAHPPGSTLVRVAAGAVAGLLGSGATGT